MNTEFKPLQTEDLQQIDGGNWQADVLHAMGWKSYTNLYLDKNGMPFYRTIWVPPAPPK